MRPVDGFLKTAATVKRMDLVKAVEQFIENRRQKTTADLGLGSVHGFSSSSEDHSAAWRRTVQQTRPCYDALLEQFNF